MSKMDNASEKSYFPGTIPPKEIIRLAAKIFNDIEDHPDLEFEELEYFDEDGKTYWAITFSYTAQERKALIGMSLLPTTKYKTVQIFAENGQLKAIKSH